VKRLIEAKVCATAFAAEKSGWKWVQTFGEEGGGVANSQIE